LSPTTTGDDLISPLVLKVQAPFPSAMRTACTVPLRSPTKTSPSAVDTAGDDSPIPSTVL
jgi:hypothetical protein